MNNLSEEAEKIVAKYEAAFSGPLQDFVNNLLDQASAGADQTERLIAACELGKTLLVMGGAFTAGGMMLNPVEALAEVKSILGRFRTLGLKRVTAMAKMDMGQLFSMLMEEGLQPGREPAPG